MSNLLFSNIRQYISNFKGSDQGFSDLSQAALEEELRIELGGDDNEHNIIMTRATTRMENRSLILRIRLAMILLL